MLMDQNKDNLYNLMIYANLLHGVNISQAELTDLTYKLTQFKKSLTLYD